MFVVIINTCVGVPLVRKACPPCCVGSLRSLYIAARLDWGCFLQSRAEAELQFNYSLTGTAAPEGSMFGSL